MASRSLKRRHSARRRPLLPGVLAIITLLLVIAGGGVYYGSTLLASWLQELPDYDDPASFETALPTIVYAADGTTELARLQLEYREPVTLDDVNQDVIDATIAIEDARFYEHGGVDSMGVMRALVNNFAGGSLEGGSTITQQYVRNTILAGEMDEISLKRKVREAYIAMKLEERQDKDEILMAYLNTVNYGAGAHGIEAAAQRYFSKSAKDLTLSEAALLAGIPQSPTYNDPIQYPDNARFRRDLVLGRMLNEHFIDIDEYNAAVAEPVELNPTEIGGDGILRYPYFTSYVRELLYNNYDLSESDILRGGLRVYTTLDIDKQEAAEEACAIKRSGLGDAMEVAMAVVEPATGNVQAIVGGSDYSASQVNLATGQGGGGRPCGSVFKTFTLVTAIKQGIDPNGTQVDCTSPATIDGYTLENYANTGYGIRTIAGAFVVSSNTGFVRLISAVGVNEVAQTAYDLGVTTDLMPEEAGAPLTLGVQNVTPLELANAVATIANGGTRHTLCAISHIEDRNGNVIVDDSDPEARAERVLTPEEAHATQEVMKGVVTSGTGTAANLYTGQPVAGKTGTSENYKDITFVGITPQIAAGIWVGDPTNEQSVPTGTCADVFHTYASTVLADQPIEDFAEAGDPEYTPYTNEYYHIYPYYYYGYHNYGDLTPRPPADDKKENDDDD